MKGAFFFLPSVIRKEVQCSMPFHQGLKLIATNDLTCYFCITESIMASEAFNNSNTLTVENIFIGHYSYYVKNVLCCKY